jgi:hypothetical protein
VADPRPNDGTGSRRYAALGDAALGDGIPAVVDDMNRMRVRKLWNHLLVQPFVCGLRGHRLEWTLIVPSDVGELTQVVQCRCGHRIEEVPRATR